MLVRVTFRPGRCRAAEQPVQAVERGDSVGLGHRRIIEGRVDEVVQRVALAGLRHDGLANVNDFRRARPETVDAQNLQRLAVEQQLEHADGLAGDLGAGEALEAALADFVRHTLLSEFAFGFSQRADFRAGIDAGRDVGDQSAVARSVDQVMRGVAALHVRGTRQRRPADDVPDRVDALGSRSEMLVDFELPARIRFDADSVEPEVFGVARPASCPQQDVRLDLLAGHQVKNDAVVARFDTLAGFPMTDDDPAFTQVVTQRVDDLVVQEFKQLFSRVDEVHFDAEVAEHRRIFAANDAGSKDADRPGRVRQVEDCVAVVNSRVGEIDSVGPVGTRARGDDDGTRLQQAPAAQFVDHFNRSWSSQTGSTTEHRHAVAIVEALPHVDLFVDHRPGRPSQAGKRQRRVERVGIEQPCVEQVGRLKNRVAERLAGDRPAVRAAPADLITVFDGGDGLPQLGGLHRSSLAAGTAANDNNVVSLSTHVGGWFRSSSAVNV